MTKKKRANNTIRNRLGDLLSALKQDAADVKQPAGAEAPTTAEPAVGDASLEAPAGAEPKAEGGVNSMDLERPGGPGGWSWECDAKGCYRTCGPEIQAALGIPAEIMLGQPLNTFALDPDSVARVKQALQSGQVSESVDVEFINQSGQPVAARLHIFNQPAEGAEPARLHGFVQILEPSQASPTETVSASAEPVTPPPGAEQPAAPEPVTTTPEVEATPSAPEPTLPTVEPETPAPAPTAPLPAPRPPSTPRQVPEWIVSSTPPMTPIGAESLQRQVALFQPGSTQTPAAMAVPLKLEEQGVGLLEVVDDTENRFWTEDERRLVEQVADQLSLALENARLFQTEQRRANELNTLVELSRLVSQNLDLNEVYSIAYRIISRVLPSDSFYINLADFEKNEKEFVFLIEKGERLPNERKPMETGFSGRVLLSGQAVRVGDVFAEEQDGGRSIPTLGATEMSRSILAVPLRSGSQVIGVMSTQSYTPNLFTEYDLRLLQTFGDTIAVAIQNARLFEQTQAALSETEALYEASAELNTAQSYEDIIEALRNHSVAGKGSNLVSIAFFDRAWQKDQPPEWVTIAGRWSTLPQDNVYQSYPIQAFPSVAVLLHPDSILNVEDVHTDPRLDENLRNLYAKRFQATTALFVPLVTTGQWIGFINITYPERFVVPESENRRLLAISGQAAVAAQNLRSLTLAEQRARESQQRSEELALVNRVVTAMVSSPDMRQVLDAVAGELLTVFNLGHVGVALLNKERTQLTVVSEKTVADQPTSVGMRLPVKGNPSSEQVIATKRPLVVPDAQTNPLVAPIHDLLRWRGVQGIVILPIITGGEVIGTVGLDILEKGRSFTARELALAETLVVQVSTAIQNANLYEQTQKALSETETLYQASAGLNSVDTYDRILEILRTSTILGHKNASSITLSVFDRPWAKEAPPEWYIPLARWSSAAAKQAERKVTPRYPISGWTTADQLLLPDRPTIIEDALKDPRLDATARAVYVEQLGAKSLVFAPLNVGGQWIGHINAVYSETTTFSEEDARPLAALAGQAAVAIQNLRLLSETRRRAAQLATAAEIARDTSGTLALETLLQRAVNLIRDRYGYYHASIFLLDEAGEYALVRASTGEAGEELKRRAHKLAVGSQSIIGTVTQTGEPLVINDVSQNEIHKPNPLLPETRAELAIPMKIGNRIIGAMDVQATEVEAFTGDDVGILRTLSDQLAVAVDNARSYELAQQAIEETRRRVQELSVLFNFTQALAAAPMETSEIGNIVVRFYMDVLNLPQGAIFLVDPESDALQALTGLERSQDGEYAPMNMTLASNPDSEAAAEGEEGSKVVLERHLADYPATVRVMQTLQPLIVHASDQQADPQELAWMAQRKLATLAILPLAVKGQSFGIIELEIPYIERRFTPDELNLAMTLSNASAVSLENARLYEEQRKTTEKLREMDKLKSQFLANMSHELRTPLNSIIGFSRVILKGIDGPISELQQQDLTAINSAGQHLLNLINDILDISKIEAGKMELAFEDEVSVADLVTSALSTAVGLTKDKPIKLVKIVPPELPGVRADPTRVRQVIINFLSNAAKFTEEGSITVKVEPAVSPEGRAEVWIGVTDTGMGISLTDQNKLFQQFTQVDASATRKAGGTGLGLAISRMMIEMHGGRIGVISEVGKGSTFWFTLPVPVKEPPVVEGQRVILAIDDDKLVINLYERYLQEHGYQVVALTDPKQAVERAREVMPFAITLDIMMPERSGWQVLEALKGDPITHDIPVIICSIVEDQAKGFSLGAADYVSKPILEEDLVRALSRLNGDGSIRNVLVVDDDEDDLRLVQKILENAPPAPGAPADQGRYQVRLAHGGPEGLAAIQANPPQAVILDLFMPELDGFTLLETMRSDPALKEIPVIIFTAGDLTEDQQKRLAEFSQAMIHKSVFKEEELLTSIERVLQRFTPPEATADQKKE